jgi:hypothetical protein
MASDRQIEANRLNALRSTGPRTAEGKAVSSKNATTHGLSGRMVVIEGEDPLQFESMRQQLLDELQPVGALEGMLVERLAAVSWRLRRTPALEAALFARQQQLEDTNGTNSPFAMVSAAFDGDAMLPDAEDRDANPELQQQAIGRSLMTLLSNADYLNKLGRHEKQLVNQMQAVLHQLWKLQAERRTVAGTVQKLD